MSENIFLIIVLILLFNSYTIKNTNILVKKLTDAINIKGCQYLSTLVLNFLIFLFIVYIYKKKKEMFQICQSGYKISDVRDSFFHPEKPWCEYGKGEKEYTTSDADLIDNLEDSSDKNNKNQFCEGDYIKAHPTESYYDSRKSWCTNKD